MNTNNLIIDEDKINLTNCIISESQSLLCKPKADKKRLKNQKFNRSVSASIQICPNIVAYKRRFLMIFFSLILCITNAYQWIQFASITNKLTFYYSINNIQVNMLSIIYFVVYVTCIIPVTKIIELKGLKCGIILGAFGNFFGALIKCFSLNQSYGFYLALIGQFFSGASALFIFNIPPEIASVWFKSEEISRVISMEVCSCFIGNTLAFFLPTLIVGDQTTIKGIAERLSVLYTGGALVTGVAFFLIIIFFEERPPTPPSLAQCFRESAAQNTSIIDLCRNRNLLTFILYSAINAGVFDALTTLLNQMILIEYPNDNSKVGSIGILFIMSGMAGSLFCGYLIDKFKKYKEISVLFYGMSIFFLILFSIKLHFSSPNLAHTKLGYLVNDYYTSNNILLHICIFGLGFFLIGYWTIRFDFGAELAYPNAAGTICGLTAACCDSFGIVITFIISGIIDSYGTLAANGTLVLFLSFGMYLLYTLKPEYKRQMANVVKKSINVTASLTRSDSTEKKCSKFNALSCKANYQTICFNYTNPNLFKSNQFAV